MTYHARSLSSTTASVGTKPNRPETCTEVRCSVFLRAWDSPNAGRTENRRPVLLLRSAYSSRTSSAHGDKETRRRLSHRRRTDKYNSFGVDARTDQATSTHDGFRRLYCLPFLSMCSAGERVHTHFYTRRVVFGGGETKKERSINRTWLRNTCRVA